ncbi:MAG: 4-(cytidine 5'-diphospho)-2-C-methyl-D-erythritol kinase [Sporichthyaceae bacterium]
MATVTVRAPAKVNLQLSVGGVRPDGYHELVNVFHAVSLFDEVAARPADDISVTVRAACSGIDVDGVPTDGTNLAVRAANLLAEHTGMADGVALEIRKAIPVAGGMAGGSADAAAALLACDLLWGTHLPRAELDELAAELGADVPFALLGHTAVGVGRGDQLTAVLGRGQFHWVFALAEGGLSAGDVYRECDRLRAHAGQSLDVVPDAADPALFAALRSGDAKALGTALRNDLQDAALSLRPDLERTLEAGLELGGLGAVLSGSGPTCAFLVASAEAALDLSVGLTALGVCRDVKRATGPVAGARAVVA